MNEFKKKQAEIIAEKVEAGGRCVLCSGLLALPPKKIADFYEAMLDKDIEAPTILEVLKTWKIKSSLTTINNHRAGRKGFARHMAILKEKAGK